MASRDVAPASCGGRRGRQAGPGCRPTGRAAARPASSRSAGATWASLRATSVRVADEVILAERFNSGAVIIRN
jgi:hypothetical protein